MPKSTLRFAALVAVMTLLAAACGDSGEPTSTVTTSAQRTTTAPTAADEGSASDIAETETSNPADAAAAQATEAPAGNDRFVADRWQLVSLGDGIKPALALDAAGSPAIAYLTERQQGAIFYSSAANNWKIDTVADGYFYGPVDIAFSPDDLANIVYHDHQAPTFRPDEGDLTLAVQSPNGWNTTASGDDGHDGWDAAIWFGPNGETWAAGIEPNDFGTAEGVEFYEYDGASWSVESIGGPAITYEFNVATATSIDGEPVLSYYDESADQLHVATRTVDGWADELVNERGGGGMFSSLVIGPDGTRYITYFASAGAGSGLVQYAVDDGSGWTIETVTTLNNVVIGNFGARRITSLQVDDDGMPIVALTDQTGVWVATRGSNGWDVTSVITAGDRAMGQQVQIIADGSTWHLTTFETTSSSPLEGEILYLSKSN